MFLLIFRQTNKKYTRGILCSLFKNFIFNIKAQVMLFSSQPDHLGQVLWRGAWLTFGYFSLLLVSPALRFSRVRLVFLLPSLFWMVLAAVSKLFTDRTDGTTRRRREDREQINQTVGETHVECLRNYHCFCNTLLPRTLAVHSTKYAPWLLNSVYWKAIRAFPRSPPH